MNNDTFDQMFKDDYDETAGYYAEAAMNYLDNIEELENNFLACTQRVRMCQQIIAEKHEMESLYESQIRNLTEKLKQKNQEIHSLRNSMKKQKNRSVNKVTNIRELEGQINEFLSKCLSDAENYKRTGRFKNLDVAINKLREFFNIFLEELNELNSENRSVLGILETLIRLERCEQKLREIRCPQIPEIVVTSS